MRAIVVGYGIQGKKRRAIAGESCVAIVDPVAAEADFRQLTEVPLTSFDLALVCTPDEPKVQLLKYLLEHGKHVLVEKPLLATEAEIDQLESLARKHRAFCYIAYNHRFEPHIANLQQIISEQTLGKIFAVDIFYGNGTARDVRNSAWRDQGLGVVPDLCSHMLDMFMFLLGEQELEFELTQACRFENQAPDYALLLSKTASPLLRMEATLLSWRNTFRLNVFAEKGTAHIDSLCKWGPSVLTVRKRVLPSGRPDEESQTLVEADPTWKLEYEYFLSQLTNPSTSLNRDRIINRVFRGL